MKMASSRTKTDSFVWTDDEAELLLKVTLDYKASKLKEDVDWESCQSKYSDILEAFLQRYPSGKTAVGKDFPHDKESISKVQLTTKLKAIRGKYRKAIDSGRRRGHGRVVSIFFELCGRIWGRSPAAHALDVGIETADVQVKLEDISASSTRCSTPTSDSSVVLDPTSPNEETAGCNIQPEAVKTRRDVPRAKLNSYRVNKLKRKLHTDPAVEEDLKIKRRMVDLLEKSERRNTERLDKIMENIATITNTIQDGFSLLRELMSQPQPNVAFSHGSGRRIKEEEEGGDGFS